MADVILDPNRWECLEAGSDALLESWCAAEGDCVQGGVVLAHARLVGEVLEIQAPHDGVLEQILVASGERFTPGQALARVVEF